MAGKLTSSFSNKPSVLPNFLAEKEKIAATLPSESATYLFKSAFHDRVKYFKKKIIRLSEQVVSVCWGIGYARPEITQDLGYKAKASTIGSCHSDHPPMTASPIIPGTMRNAKHDTLEASYTHVTKWPSSPEIHSKCNEVRAGSCSISS